jgi:hypothetical protein
LLRLSGKNMDDNQLLRSDYIPRVKIFDIESPAIETGATYFFISGSGLRYEVRFGKKKDNYLGHVVNFSVLDDAFEDEYSVTNKGELYSVIATVIEIVRQFHAKHPSSDTYEFSGEFKDDRDRKDEASIRTKLYFRYAQQVLAPNWRIDIQGNKSTIHKVR